MPELLVLVPTRGRPDNIRKVISAWDFTNAWDVADLWLIVDQDDPEIQGYRDLEDPAACPMRLAEVPTWRPMVHKLNEVAAQVAAEGRYFAVAFAGDDHLPQTIGWAERYLAVLHELGSGMAYGDDGYHGRKLSTEWAVTADAVAALGRMVPAPVEHLYCDNAMMDLFGGAGALRHLPEVRIEHFNPYAKGKAPMDDQYKRVNGSAQYKRDRASYEGWKRSGLVTDIRTVRALRPGRPDVRPEPVRPEVARAKISRGPDRLRSGPTSRGRINAMTNRFPFSREFKEVRGATPDEIGMALADFASQVPPDQEIVELGVFQGRTALIMAWGAGQGLGAHVTGIDPWDLEGNVYDPPFTEAASRDWARYRVRELGYTDRIELVNAFSQDVGADWTGKRVGLLFVDGDHTRLGARRDIEVWAEHLAPGAVIAVDDYGHPDWPGVGEALDELVAEGLLAPLEIFHDRLAVTRLASDPAATTAITSEGVSPSPVAPISTEPGCQHAECVLDHPHDGPAVLRSALEAEWERVDPEGVAALRESAAALDTQVSSQEPGLRVVVSAGELDGVAEGTSISELTIPQMKALARARGIVLGARKDKRDLIVQALADGR